MLVGIAVLKDGIQEPDRIYVTRMEANERQPRIVEDRLRLERTGLGSESE
jgi:hypothetical protein